MKKRTPTLQTCVCMYKEYQSVFARIVRFKICLRQMAFKSDVESSPLHAALSRRSPIRSHQLFVKGQRGGKEREKLKLKITSGIPVILHYIHTSRPTAVRIDQRITSPEAHGTESVLQVPTASAYPGTCMYGAGRRRVLPCTPSMAGHLLQRDVGDQIGLHPRCPIFPSRFTDRYPLDR